MFAHISPANEQKNFPRALRQKEAGLTGGIAAAHHDHRVAAAKLRFHLRRGVIDSRAIESFSSLNVEFSVIRIAGDNHGLRPHLFAVCQVQHGNAVGKPELRRLRRN